MVYPYLFKAGAFKIIRDLTTGQWRALDPVLDKDRAEEAKPAPPLIPPRMIKHQSWVLKSSGYIQTCELTNGWEIFFFSSEGDPPQGFQLDICHIDEDLNNEAWVPEMQARLADRKGRFIWSAMPHSKNEALIGLNERAESAASTGRDTIKKFTFRFLDNAFIDQAEKAKMIERWAAIGDDVLRQRAEGEFTTDSILVYPNFNISVHGITRDQLPEGVIPPEWTRYAVIDPGHAVTAVLFAVVPPENDKVILFDELYLRNCNAVIFGDEFARKVQGQNWYAFLIDSHGARLTDIGSGKTPQDQYTERLVELGVRSKTTGSSFLPGSDDIQAGLHSVRTALHIRQDGTPRLRVLRGSLPNLERELKRYRKKTVNVAGTTIVTDEPNKRGDFHLVDCLRYLFAYNPKFHEMEKVVEHPWWFDWKKKRDKERGQEGVVYLAPSSYTSEFYV